MLWSNPNEVELTLAVVRVVSVRNWPVRATSFLNVVTSPAEVVLVGGVAGGGVVDVGGGVVGVESPPPPPQAVSSAATVQHTRICFMTRGLQMSPPEYNIRRSQTRSLLSSYQAFIQVDVQAALALPGEIALHAVAHDALPTLGLTVPIQRSVDAPFQCF